MTLRIGITGGIGSGKTTVCRIFELLGIPVYYADDRAKWLMTADEVLKQGIMDQFGTEAYDQAGQLNRAYLAGIVFHDRQQLDILNGLVHPAVARDSEQWQQAHNTAPYTLREAALLFESGSFRNLDKIITVTAPVDLRIERVRQRDHTSVEEVRARMDKQWPEEEKVKLSDFVIINDGQHGLIRQVWDLHQLLIKENKAA